MNIYDSVIAGALNSKGSIKGYLQNNANKSLDTFKDFLDKAEKIGTTGAISDAIKEAKESLSKAENKNNELATKFKKNEETNPILHRTSPICGKVAMERSSHGTACHGFQSSADSAERSTLAILHPFPYQDGACRYRQLCLPIRRYTTPPAQGTVCGEWRDKSCERHTRA